MSTSSINPQKINMEELLEYYNYKGRLGLIKFHFKHLYQWLLQVIAKSSPHPGLTVFCQKARGVKIGNNVFIGPNVHIDDLYPHLVNIEDYVSIGMNTMIFAHSNPTCSIYLKANHYPRKIAPVNIQEGSWIPPGCIILGGVTIGKNSVIGAGSVVLKTVEPLTMVAGNPAKFIKEIE